MMRFLLVSLTILLGAASISDANEKIVIDDFNDGLAPGWSVKSFVGFNDYRVVTDGSEQVLLAESNGTASSLYFKKNINLSEYPILEWRWKIEAIVPGGDVSRKESDDYPARIYVVFPHWLFTRIRSINYIWANRLPKDEIVPSPYTANSQMVAVESGNERAGEWLSARRNVYKDYRRIFGEEPREVGGIAIMSDSDNTGESARAWYDDLRFVKE
jgi:hypothetical protein